MNFTLDVCGEKQIRNPSEAQIRQAVSGLDSGEGDAFLILGPTETSYIQASGDQAAGFDLEFQESDIKHHYRAKRTFTADEVVKAFVSYSTGSEDWKRMAEWEPLR